jgi:hypothetical protein
MHKGVPLGTEPKKKHTPEHGPYWGFIVTSSRLQKLVIQKILLTVQLHLYEFETILLRLVTLK